MKEISYREMQNLPIGFLDSGLGGISVLKEAVRILPNEKFIYFGDSKNAPYGTKSKEKIKELTFNAVSVLMEEGIKALVVACNTATGVAIKQLREKYKDFIIIGIEPAIKPAANEFKGGEVIVMATPMTIKQEKFKNLVFEYSNVANITPLGCPGLMEFVEEGEFNQDTLNKYFDIYLRPVLSKKTDAVVLGCTHYPFLRLQIGNYLDKLRTEKKWNKKIVLMDGSYGTSMELKRRLEAKELLIENATYDYGREKLNEFIESKGQKKLKNFNEDFANKRVKLINSARDKKYAILGEKLLNYRL